jgi:hypothetical protein
MKSAVGRMRITSGAAMMRLPVFIADTMGQSARPRKGLRTVARHPVDGALVTAQPDARASTDSCPGQGVDFGSSRAGTRLSFGG